TRVVLVFGSHWFWFCRSPALPKHGCYVLRGLRTYRVPDGRGRGPLLCPRPRRVTARRSRWSATSVACCCYIVGNMLCHISATWRVVVRHSGSDGAGPVGDEQLTCGCHVTGRGARTPSCNSKTHLGGIHTMFVSHRFANRLVRRARRRALSMGEQP